MKPQNKKNDVNHKQTGLQRTNKLITVVATRDFALSSEYTPAPIRAVWTANAQEFSEEENERRKQEKIR